MKIQLASKSAILMVFCLSFLAEFHAQTTLKKGYYKAKSDSTRVDGYFDFSLTVYNSVSFFKEINQEKALELYPNDVACIIGADGEYIVPITIKYSDATIDLFATRIFNADVSLFEGKIQGERDIYFLSSKKLPALKRINEKTPEAFLRAYLGETCGPKKQVLYKKNSLSEALKNYAKCSGAAFTISPKNHFKLNLALGARAGFYLSTPTVTGFYGPEYNQMKGPVFGGDLQIGLFRNFYTRIGFAYSQNTLLKEGGIKVAYKFRGWPFTYSDPVQFSYTTYEVPLDLVWTFNHSKKTTLFASIGLHLIQNTAPVTEKYFTIPDDFDFGFYSFNEVDILNSLLGEMKVDHTLQISGQVKAGAIFRLKNRTFFELSLRYAPRKQSFHRETNGEPLPLVVNNRDWFDISLAYYLPLTKGKSVLK